MPELMSAALFEKNARVLVVRRRRAPFAGQFVLPLIAVGEFEAAEEAMRNHARAQFGLTLVPDTEQFVETVYIAEGDSQFIANIFRATLPDGAMRFNADGDYDDARWLTAEELDSVAMPPDLRIPLAKILTDPDALHELDWDRMGSELATAEEARPIAERAAPVDVKPPPDAAAGWNAIAAAYQAECYGDRDAGRLKWSWGLFEEDLHILDDVRGMRALVLGSGGGQDAVALANMGAIAVGIDLSKEQIAYAKRYAIRHGAANASFVEGDVEDLARFDDASFDLAISIHVLGHVPRAGVAIAEAARVLKPGGILAITLPHPFNHTRDSEHPYGIIRPYWARAVDWRWDFENKTGADFRHYPHTMQEWFEMLTGAGFTVERLVEPQQQSMTGEDAKQVDTRLAKLVPYALILKARKR